MKKLMLIAALFVGTSALASDYNGGAPDEAPIYNTGITCEDGDTQLFWETDMSGEQGKYVLRTCKAGSYYPKNVVVLDTCEDGDSYQQHVGGKGGKLVNFVCENGKYNAQ